MIGFKEFKNMQDLSDLLIAYNLNLNYLSEAINQNGPDGLTEEIMNEFLKTAFNTAVGAVQGAVQGAKDKVAQKNMEAAKRDALKHVTNFKTSLEKMGIEPTKVNNVISQITNYTQKAFDSNMKNNMFAQKQAQQQAKQQAQQAQQAQQQTPQAQQKAPAGTQVAPPPGSTVPAKNLPPKSVLRNSNLLTTGGAQNFSLTPTR